MIHRGPAVAGGTEARTHRVLKVIFYPEEHSRRQEEKNTAPSCLICTLPPFNGGEASQIGVGAPLGGQMKATVHQGKLKL